jgi:ubiquinone/menaquinone biosynthesis C-methylase UbiE
MATGAESPDYTFDAFARQDFYRKVNEHLVDGTLQIRSRLAQTPIHRVLDLACGTGAVTQLLVERLRRFRDPVDVVAVDPSDSALEKARRRLGDAARFVRGTAEAFSGIATGIDVIVFCNAIHLLPDKDHVLGEARKALNDSGVLAFNTAYYHGCYVPGTERFYKLWMLRARQQLKQETGMRPEKPTTEAMHWLTADQYRALLERHGFVVEDMHAEEAQLSLESWQDISQYSEFANGALPGVPVEVAVPVLKQSAAQALHELGVTEIARNWLQVVARTA